MSSAVGRLVVDVQTNKSGGAVAYGDVVVNDGSNAHAFTTTTTAGFTAGVIGVCIEPNGIANNASGRIQYQGYCAQVNTNASVTNGYFLKTHTVAKQAAGSATRVVGSFGVAMSTATNPAALLWGFPDATAAAGNVAADAIWDAKGDLAGGTGADTAARLAVGANDTILMADSTQTTGLKWVASDTPSTQAFGDAAAVGTADTFTRGDHKHAMPAASSLPGYEFDYAQFTSPVTVSATAEASPTNIVVGNSVAYDGATTVMIEFFAPWVNDAGTGDFLDIWLYDGTSSIGRLFATQLLSSNVLTPVHAVRRLTPSNASHTYKVGGVRGSANATVTAGAGGAGNVMPGFLRITRV